MVHIDASQMRLEIDRGQSLVIFNLEYFAFVKLREPLS